MLDAKFLAERLGVRGSIVVFMPYFQCELLVFFPSVRALFPRVVNRGFRASMLCLSSHGETSMDIDQL